MVSKKWWEEDEAEKAKKRETREQELFISQYIIWETQLLWNECRNFILSFEKRMARLRELIDHQEREIDQDFQDLEES